MYTNYKVKKRKPRLKYGKRLSSSDKQPARTYVLADDEVKEIKRLYESTAGLKYKDPKRYTQDRLAVKFGVGRGTIHRIVTDKAYRWVE